MWQDFFKEKWREVTFAQCPLGAGHSIWLQQHTHQFRTWPVWRENAGAELLGQFTRESLNFSSMRCDTNRARPIRAEERQEPSKETEGQPPKMKNTPDLLALQVWRANRARGPGLRDMGCREKPNLDLGWKFKFKGWRCLKTWKGNRGVPNGRPVSVCNACHAERWGLGVKSA